MEFISPNVNVDFVGKRFFFVMLSLAINILSIIMMLFWGLNYGLDFVGGSMVEVRFTQPTTNTAIQQAIGNQNLEDLTIQDLSRNSTVFMLRFKQSQNQNLSDISDAVQKDLTATFGQNCEVLRSESIGSKVSSDLYRRGFLAVTFTTLLMGSYLALRFDPRFGLGAVIALIHDVLVVTGALTLTQMPFDLSVLAALLTVVGYSVHDTIIVSDRIRENLRHLRRETLATIINRSINETLSRTIITSGTAITVLVALFSIGSHVIRPFAFTLRIKGQNLLRHELSLDLPRAYRIAQGFCLIVLIVGFITGTYSSIYIAAPVVLYFENRFVRLGSSTKS